MRLIASVFILSLSANSYAVPNLSFDTCFEHSGHDLSEILTCQAQAQQSVPLDYSATAVEQLPDLQKRSYQLKSQHWSPQGRVTPAQWQHEVLIYIPDNALPGQALLVANNGTPNAGSTRPAEGPTDFTEDMALSIARATRTIVISVSNIPSQYLTYSDGDRPLREDDSVAHTWKLFLEAPEQRPTLPLHVPMVQSMIKAMDLAQQELKAWQVDSFIVSGASKRGWASWLTALSDQRVSAIVPFVIDILNMDKVLEHTRRAYGNSWPLAFNAYQRAGIIRQLDTENFNKLLRLQDPWRYLDTRHAPRLAIPKYIVNASGDDFFLPDSSTFYYPHLPGQKSLRMVPNSSHYGIRDQVEQSLTRFIDRIRQQRPLPTITTTLKNERQLSVTFSEKPVQVVQWTANNPQARDFRYACGVRYQASSLKTGNTVLASFSEPAQGWSATFIEATFSDGMVATSEVRIVPDTYPTERPPVIEPACKTLVDN